MQAIYTLISGQVTLLLFTLSEVFRSLSPEVGMNASDSIYPDKPPLGGNNSFIAGTVTVMWITLCKERARSHNLCATER